MTATSTEEARLEFTSDLVFGSCQLEAGCQAKFEVTFKPAGIALVQERSVANVRKEVSLPGFRKGKVPANVIAQKYAGAIAQERREECVQEAVRQGLVLSKQRPYRMQLTAAPQIVDKDGEMRVTFTMEMWPKVPTIDVAKLNLKKDVKAVEESEIERELAAVRKHFIQYEAADCAAERGMQVRLKIEQGEEVLGEDGLYTLNDESTVIWLLEAVLGHKVGDVLDVTDSADPRLSDEEKANYKPTTYRVTVNSVLKAKDLSNEELAKQLKMESFDDIKKVLSQRIQGEHEQDAMGQVEEQLEEQLLALYNFDLPTSIFKAEVQSRVSKPAAEDKNLSSEELEAKMSEQASSALRLFFLYGNMMAEAGLKVTDAEVNEYVAMMTRSLGERAKKASAEVRKAWSNNAYNMLVSHKAKQHLIATVMGK